MFALLKDKPFLRATAVLIGTMVGVGVFGIPFSFARSGLWIGLSFLLGIGAVTLLLDLMYGEIVLRTHKSHQLVGYTETYLGVFWKRLIFFSIILNTYAALLAYVIISGDFLTNIFSSVFYSSPETLSLWFFAIVSFFVLFGIRAVSWVELILAWLFIAIIFLIFGFGVSSIDTANFSYNNPELWFFPYGILLFAFGGLSSIPIQRQLLAGEEKKFRKSIFTAVVIVGILYFIFGLTVLGISGDMTSADAISGLVNLMGGRILFLGSLFGILAVTTSYLMLGTAMLEIFHLDYGIPRRWSWLLVIIPPLILFLGGLRNFIDVISLAGAVAVGLEAFVLIFVYIKAKSRGDRIPEYSMFIPAWLLYIIGIVFLGGIGYTFFTR